MGQHDETNMLGFVAWFLLIALMAYHEACGGPGRIFPTKAGTPLHGDLLRDLDGAP